MSTNESLDDQGDGSDRLRHPGQLRTGAVARSSWLIVSLGIVVLLCGVSVALGTGSFALEDVIGAFQGEIEGVGQAAVHKRIPRTVLALLIGASLSISGATMQAITRNPIAEPGILGVSSGAALAVVIGIAFFGLSDPYGFIDFAIVGSAVAAVFVCSSARWVAEAPRR